MYFLKEAVASYLLVTFAILLKIDLYNNQLPPVRLYSLLESHQIEPILSYSTVTDLARFLG